MSKHFYITTTLPYVNADPHIGFAQEIVYADILARFHHLLGEKVFFNTGTDEHGQKLYEKALEAGQTPKAYVDGYAEKFRGLLPLLHISPDIHFIRTTDEKHIVVAQEFWKKCVASGDIYKAKYSAKYCVGCELTKTDSELVDGFCPLHFGKPLELIDEENYFFKFSKYQDKLLELYEKSDFVVPVHRLREVREFVAGGLKDFSISRQADKMPWGIPVPGDSDQVMYVWFDALVNYISTLEWGMDKKSEIRNPKSETNSDLESRKQRVDSHDKLTTEFEEFWGSYDQPNAVQIAGKDNLRQQAAMWQAMLMSAGLPPSRQIIIHGFFTSQGQKMSKTLGNTISPIAVVDTLLEKGVGEDMAPEALRYFLARETSTFEDSDFTWERFFESYNAGLANGLGNLVSRILKMAKNAEATSPFIPPLMRGGVGEGLNFDPQYQNYLEKFEIQKAGEWIWAKAKRLDEYIAQEEPFKVVKIDVEKGQKQIEYLLSELAVIAFHLQPFLPTTAEKILSALKSVQSEGLRLFPRVEVGK